MRIWRVIDDNDIAILNLVLGIGLPQYIFTERLETVARGVHVIERQRKVPVTQQLPGQVQPTIHNA